jgi:hypothetical protein
MEDNIKMEVGAVACGVYWIQLAQDTIQWRAVVNTVMNLLIS